MLTAAPICYTLYYTLHTVYYTCMLPRLVQVRRRRPRISLRVWPCPASSSTAAMG